MVNVYALKKTLRSLATPYFILNTIASFFHPLLRFTPGLCNWVGGNCTLDFYECEIYFFVICVVAIKNRRCVSVESYLSTLFVFAKAGAAILFYKMSIQLAIWYTIFCIVLMVTVRTPSFEESSEMKYFVDNTLPEQLKNDKHSIWVVEFYTTFSPHCNAVKPIFGALSREYTHDYMKFGKCDVLKSHGVPESYDISSSCLRTELPAIIVFEGGVPAARIKQTNNGKQYLMSYENLKRDLQLQEFYEKALEKSKNMKSAESNKKTENKKKK
ncbi:thioredoxin-related transmembrane protein 2-like isoform X1 [Bolinopsis microptera]|uniref:thioredoxin-related transmembrane protein 2-like isoform X1 n=2 Tax=Bolinopsis microptera TaxID=2820187 RepID=UPI00307AA8B2